MSEYRSPDEILREALQTILEDGQVLDKAVLIYTIIDLSDSGGGICLLGTEMQPWEGRGLLREGLRFTDELEDEARDG